MSGTAIEYNQLPGNGGLKMGQEELLTFLKFAATDTDFQNDINEGNYCKAFKRAGLPEPTDAQTAALKGLPPDWPSLQTFSESFSVSPAAN